MTSSAGTKPFTEKPAPRITVLDAIDLDTEIQRVLKEQLLKIFNTLSPSCVKWEPELDTLLRVIVWKLSMHQLGATFGQQLLSVQYSHKITPRRAAAWALLTIGTQYLAQRSPELTTLLHPDHRDRMRQAVGWMELAIQTVSLLNSLVFLRDGVFPSVADRVVGIAPVSSAVTSRVVGYSFMTRELLWHGFIEFMVFLVPLVNVRWWQRRLWWSDTVKPVGDSGLITSCAVCHQPPCLPYQMGCGHAFCYYCLQSNRIADTKFGCPSCGCIAEDERSIQPLTARSFRNL